MLAQAFEDKEILITHTVLATPHLCDDGGTMPLTLRYVTMLP